MNKEKETVTIPVNQYLEMLKKLTIWKLKIFFSDIDIDNDVFAEDYLNDLYERNPDLFGFNLDLEEWENWELWEDKAIKFYEDYLFDDEYNEELDERFDKIVDYYFKRKKAEREQRKQTIERLETAYQLVA